MCRLVHWCLSLGLAVGVLVLLVFVSVSWSCAWCFPWLVSICQLVSCFWSISGPSVVSLPLGQLDLCVVCAFVGCSFGWSLCWLVGRSLIGPTIGVFGLSVGWSLDQLVFLSVIQLVSPCVCQSFNRSHSWSVPWSIGWRMILSYD